MCGIVAQHGSADQAELEEMLERLRHRGPDDSGTVVLDHGWLGHRRLSIVDVDGGAQPLVLADGSAHLVGNGEVYNHAELRAGLDGEPLTRSDNEVALHLLATEGPEALARLNGMFAFVMAGRGRALRRRPRPGRHQAAVLDPAARAGRRGPLRLRDARLRAVLAAAGASRSRPATPGRPRTASCASPPRSRDVTGPPPADPVGGTREVLVHAVERQMMGDVPVGVFLSGGLDSSLVAAIAARWCARNGQTLQTFAVGTEDSPDLVAAREVAEAIGSEHHECTYTAEEALAVLPEVVRSIESFDPGLVRSAVPNHLLARMTARHVKVVLTGEGADELFAGYDYLHQEGFDTAEDLHAELERTVRSLHNLNLQRCDRVTMAHGLEARVPFLDAEVVCWALRLPAEAKVLAPGRAEKALLREAFDGWLPDHLLWRTKAEFGDGSGARDVLTEAVEATVDDAEFEAERTAVEPPLRTKEEVAYHRIWRAHLEAVSPERTLSRFARA